MLAKPRPISMVAEHMRRSLEHHVIEQVLDTPNFKAFYLKTDWKTRMMSTLICFTPEGITLTGDLTPGQNGNVSCYGYGLGWFGSMKSEHYLCEKFLSKVFVPEYAAADLYEQILSYRREGAISKEKARTAFDDLTHHRDELREHTFYEIFSECFEDTSEIGYDYDPGEGGWLCAIQQKFAELYEAKIKKEAEDVSNAGV